MRETYHATHNQYDECISQCLPFVNLLDFRVSALVSQEENRVLMREGEKTKKYYSVQSISCKQEFRYYKMKSSLFSEQCQR